MKNKVSVYSCWQEYFSLPAFLISNILASKIIQIGPWSVPAGVLIFPLAYIINDVIAEVWGYASAADYLGRIWSEYVGCVLFMLAIYMPAAPFYEAQDAFQTILGSSVRIVFASLTAYVVGSFLNAYVMSKFKLMTKGKGFSLRAIMSTIVGEGADSMIFISIAFVGIFPLPVILSMIVTQALLKTAYEILVLPLTIMVVKKVKAIEGVDTFDENISYNPFYLKQV